MKRMLSAKDTRISKEKRQKNTAKELKKKKEFIMNGGIIERHVPQASSAMFLQYNEQLGPPYHILVSLDDGSCKLIAC